MRLFSILILTFLCVTTALTAPTELLKRFEWNLPKDEKTWNAIRQYQQCQINLIDELSQKFGERKLWPKYHPQFQTLIEQWKMCTNAGDKETVFNCNKMQAKEVFELMQQYLQLVEFENRQVFDEFFEEKLAKCYYYDTEQFQFLTEAFQKVINEESLGSFGWKPPKDYPWPKYYQCYVNLLGEISNVHGMAETWDKYRPTLQTLIDKWECPGVTNQIDFEICNRDKALPIYKILKEFTDLMFTKFPQSEVDFLQKQAKCFSIVPKEL